MINIAVVKYKSTQTGSLTGKCCNVGSGHPRNLCNSTFIIFSFPFPHCFTCKRLTCSGLALVIVFDVSVALLLLSEPYIEVEVEIATERRCPWKRPAQSLFIFLQFCKRCS